MNGWQIVELIVHIILFLLLVPVTPVLCAFIAVLITGDPKDAPPGAFIGYILGIIFWVINLVIAIVFIVDIFVPGG